jgi:hypothetical protein
VCISGSWQSFEPAQWKLATLWTSTVDAGNPLNQYSRVGTLLGILAQVENVGTSSVNPLNRYSRVGILLILAQVENVGTSSVAPPLSVSSIQEA